MFRTGSSLCMIWTLPGVPVIWSSGQAELSAKAIKTRKFISIAMWRRNPSTPTSGKLWKINRSLFLRSWPQNPLSVPVRMWMKLPCPTQKSKLSVPGTNASRRKWIWISTWPDCAWWKPIMTASGTAWKTRSENTFRNGSVSASIPLRAFSATWNSWQPIPCRRKTLSAWRWMESIMQKRRTQARQSWSSAKSIIPWTAWRWANTAAFPWPCNTMLSTSNLNSPCRAKCPIALYWAVTCLAISSVLITPWKGSRNAWTAWKPAWKTTKAS